MDARRVLALVLVLAAAAVLGATVLPGLLAGDPGEYERTTVTAYGADGTELAAVDVRVADTLDKRYTGLSETESLGENEGMLFVHPEEDRHSYVMRGMSFPLDIVFVAENGTVTHIAHADVDGTDAPYSGRAKYVLEVDRGWTNRTGLDVGDRVGIPQAAQTAA